MTQHICDGWSEWCHRADHGTDASMESDTIVAQSALDGSPAL